MNLMQWITFKNGQKRRETINKEFLAALIHQFSMQNVKIANADVFFSFYHRRKKIVVSRSMRMHYLFLKYISS